jgi:GxxExxY protein
MNVNGEHSKCAIEEECVVAHDSGQINELVKKVVGACYEVSNVLGAGFLEKVYERALIEELRALGIQADAQVPLPVYYKGSLVGEYFVDILVEGYLIIELKCCDALADEHLAQTINYLKATNRSLALLVNFQHPKVQWRRVYRNYTP